jgi:hypothetical protein
MEGLRITDDPSGLKLDSGSMNEELTQGHGNTAIACHILLAVVLVLVASQFTHLAIVAAPANSPDMAFGECVVRGAWLG